MGPRPTNDDAARRPERNRGSADSSTDIRRSEGTRRSADRRVGKTTFQAIGFWTEEEDEVRLVRVFSSFTRSSDSRTVCLSFSRSTSEVLIRAISDNIGRDVPNLLSTHIDADKSSKPEPERRKCQRATAKTDPCFPRRTTTTHRFDSPRHSFRSSRNSACPDSETSKWIFSMSSRVFISTEFGILGDRTARLYFPRFSSSST